MIIKNPYVGIILFVVTPFVASAQFHVPEPVILAGAGSFSPADSISNRLDPNTTDSLYAGVGSLAIDSLGSSLLGSGVAISPWHVLTAGHNVDTNDDGAVDPDWSGSFQLNFGSSLSHLIPIESATLAPTFTGFLNSSVNDDLAVLNLAQRLPDGVPYYNMWNEIIEMGLQFSMVGYGQSGDGVTGYTIAADGGLKRVGGNRVDSFWGDDDGGPLDEIYIYDFDAPETFDLVDGTIGNLEESLIGQGDSGSPAFIESDGQLYIVGINTFTMGAGNGRFGDQGGGVLIYPYQGWIASITAVPEPSSTGLILGLVSMGLGVMRKRRRD